MLSLQEQKSREAKCKSEVEHRIQSQQSAEQQHIVKYIKTLQSYQDQLAEVRLQGDTDHSEARKLCVASDVIWSLLNNALDANSVIIWALQSWFREDVLIDNGRIARHHLYILF